MVASGKRARHALLDDPQVVPSEQPPWVTMTVILLPRDSVSFLASADTAIHV